MGLISFLSQLPFGVLKNFVKGIYFSEMYNLTSKLYSFWTLSSNIQTENLSLEYFALNNMYLWSKYIKSYSYFGLQALKM